MTGRAHRYGQVAACARSNTFFQNAGYAVATAFMMLGVLDAISTNWALSVGAIEVNEFMRWLQESLGQFWFIPKIMLQALVAMMIIWSPNKPTVVIMILTCCWTANVVANNFLIAASLS